MRECGDEGVEGFGVVLFECGRGAVESVVAASVDFGDVPVVHVAEYVSLDQVGDGGDAGGGADFGGAFQADQFASVCDGLPRVCFSSDEDGQYAGGSAGDRGAVCG